MRLYLDSSALVKLVQHEVESDALRQYLRAHANDQRVASELVRVEVTRTVVRGGPAAVAHARRQLARLYLVVMDRQLLEQAAMLAAGSMLRNLDAIHLATAQLLGSEMRSIVTYDVRIAQAATALGLIVAAPPDGV